MLHLLPLTFALTGALLRLPAAAVTPPVPATLSADLDGDGTDESVAATQLGKRLSLEVRGADGKKLLAEAAAPLPPPASGPVELSLTQGALGSTGALLEVVAASASEECRSVWRFRDGKLSRVPVITASGPSPDCGKRGEWIWSWERPKEDAPAAYRRERTRETAEGPHRRVEVFKYAGFRLEPDSGRSLSEIRGVAIPAWNSVRLYHRGSLDGLYARYDLTGVKRGTRLSIQTDAEAGIFSVRVGTTAEQQTFPVTRVEKAREKNDYVLFLGASDSQIRLRVTLAGGSAFPGEAVLTGLSKQADGLFNPAMRMSGGVLQIFPRAEDELAMNGLVGTWSGPKGSFLPITLAGTDPVSLTIGGKARFGLEVEGAPDGLDALLAPRDGGAPTTGLILRGPNVFARVPVRCSGAAGAPRDCRASGAEELLHRRGARLNAR